MLDVRLHAFRCYIFAARIACDSGPLVMIASLADSDFLKRNLDSRYCLGTEVFRWSRGQSPRTSCPDVERLLLAADCVVMLSVALCLRVWNALTFESLEQESSFLVCRCVFRISRSDSYIKVIELRSRSQEQKACNPVVYLNLNNE